MNKLKNGQSTLEFVIMTAAVVSAFIIFLGPNGAFQRSLQDTHQHSLDDMNRQSELLSLSRSGSVIGKPKQPPP